MKEEVLENNINKFNEYISGKNKVDKICERLVEDIKNNNKNEFLMKWKLFQEKFKNIENLKISRIFANLIEYEKTSWFDKLPFNKGCYAVTYAAKKYYNNNTQINKEILDICFTEMSKISKQNSLKEFENLKNYLTLSFYETDNKKCMQSLSVLLEFDNLYKSLNPQNPDKFLTYMIISQGKVIEAKNINISEDIFFKTVTVKLMGKLINTDGIGASKLNNKKDSQSLNQIYKYFQKYYNYVKLDNKLVKSENNNNNNEVKKIKI